MTASIRCPRCGMVSYHPTDIAEGYCAHCNDWTSHPHTQVNHLGPFTGTATIRLDVDAPDAGVEVSTSVDPEIPPSGSADPPANWSIQPAGRGYDVVRVDGLAAAHFPTMEQATEFVAARDAEDRLEWGAIMRRLDDYTGLSYACRHDNHFACPSALGAWSTCACWCHQEDR